MCTKNCLCNSCYKRNKCSDCPYIDTQDISNNSWSLICSTTGIQSCDYYIKPPEIDLEIEERKQTIIKFKNGSTIETIENSGEIIRGKMHDFQFEDISAYIKYLKKNPYKYVELVTGKKLYPLQRLYLQTISKIHSKKGDK